MNELSSMSKQNYWKEIAIDKATNHNFFVDGSLQYTDNGWATMEFVLPENLSSGILNVSNNSDIRIYVLLTACLNILINRHKNINEIFIGTSAYKSDKIKRCINDVLIIKSQINREDTFKEIVIKTGRYIYQAHENNNIYLEQILKEQINKNNYSCFDISVLMENIHDTEPIYRMMPNIVFTFSRTSLGIKCNIVYKAPLYRFDTIERIKNHYINILKESLNNTNIRIQDIMMITQEEKKQLIYGFNQTDSKYPENETIHGLFYKQVEEIPECTAVVYKDRALTYKELNHQANVLAKLLLENGIQEEEVILLRIERSVEMVVALLGILKSGAAYVPISLELPERRMEEICTECRAKVMITNLKVNKNYKRDGLKIIYTDKINWSIPVEELSLASENNLAYVMFTSGSTGKPKGVMVEHRSVINTLSWFIKVSKLGKGRRIPLMYEYNSDPSVEDIFAPLISGGTLYVIDKYTLMDKKEFRCFMEENKINVLNFVPRMIKELLSKESKINNLEVILSGGEELDDHLKDELLQVGYELYNDYGPTETTIDSLSQRCSSKKVTIGKAIDNMQCYVLDGTLIQPIGVVGELYISGIGVARGYVNRPELTGERFVENPFLPGKRMYKTGDLVRWTREGEVEFLGRMDSQVKIRGYRIELSEIEIKLRNYDRVKDAYVTIRKEGGREDSLYAFIVLKESCSHEKIKEYLSRELPEYMIPSEFIELERIPLNNVGKVDPSQLDYPESNVNMDKCNKKSHSDEIEEIIYEIWKDLIGVEEYDREMNFFEIGGSSMDLIVFNRQIKERLEIELPITALFDNPTISKLNDYIKYITEQK